MNPKKAKADLNTLKKIFSLPEGELSVLSQIEKEISTNLNGYLKQIHIAGDLDPQNLESGFMEYKIPNEPKFVEDQTKFLFEKVVKQSVRTFSPSFIGHMTSALPYFMYPLGKIMLALNQNLVKIETSKAFTPLENQVIAMLHNLIYQLDECFYQNHIQNSRTCLGVFTSGGTIANLTALWVARNNLLCKKGDYQGVAFDGISKGLKVHGYQDIVLLGSKYAHYSLKKAADLLGLGRNQIHNLKTVNGNVDTLELEKKLSFYKKNKIGVVALIGVAGATETGYIDPLNEMANIARENNIHFHVDAAWGGPVLFSQKHSPLLFGIEKADSVTIDAHKQLYCPLSSGICLFKNPNVSDVIEFNANYIIRKGSRDLGKRSVEGSRSGMAMLVHSALNIIGAQGFEIIIDQGINKTQEFARIIKAEVDFELMTQPVLNILTYRFSPKWLQDHAELFEPQEIKLVVELLNMLCVSLQKRQRERGKSFVSRTSIFKKFKNNGPDLENIVFRVVLANPLTTVSNLNEILAEQHKDAMDIWNEFAQAQKFDFLKKIN